MRRMLNVSLCLLTLYSFGCRHAELRDGDIVFHRSKSRQSTAIRLATGSDITHMGMIVMRKGKPYVFEAVSPSSRPKANRVGLTSYADWVRRGKDNEVWIKRLTKGLTAAQLKKMQVVGKSLRGKRYDRLFQWDDSTIYCSELVYDVYHRGAGVSLGEVQRVSELNLKPAPVRALIKERLGKKLDLDEKIITPIAIFNDPKLESVYAP